MKHEHALVGVDLPGVRRTVEATVEHLRSALGEEAWAQGMNPDLPGDDEVLDNPYQYTDYKSDSTHGARGTVFGEPIAGCRPLEMTTRTGKEAATWRDGVPGPTSSRRWRAGSTSWPCFDADHRTMSLSEVATAADLARPTARRLLLTLQELGYVRSVDGGFAADPEGASAWGWATSARSGCGTSPGRTWRRSYARTGESSSMAQLDGSDIVYVARVSVPKIIALRVEIGTRFPAAQTSQGKVLLAALSAERARGDPRRSPAGPACPPYIGRSHDQLLAELTQVRARGWALADEELAPGVRSVAVPVRDGTGAVRAAMNVTVHAAETSTEVLLEQHLPQAAAHRRRRQRRVGAVAVAPAHRGRGRLLHRLTAPADAGCGPRATGTRHGQEGQRGAEQAGAHRHPIAGRGAGGVHDEPDERGSRCQPGTQAGGEQGDPLGEAARRARSPRSRRSPR